MKFLKIIGVILFILFAGAAAFIIHTPGITHSTNTGPDFEYQGFNKVENSRFDRIREYIPLKDGTKLAITTLIPNNSNEKRFPTILSYTPYTSSIVVPEMSWIDRIGSKYSTGNWGPVFETYGIASIHALTSNGYALAFVDMRGTGSSTGYSAPFDPLYISDADEVLNWIAQQPWSDQKIGMMGQSYLGWAQFAAASTKNPYLKCINPQMIFFNMYSEAIRPGGILAQRWISEYSKSTLQLNNRNLWNTQYDIPSYPSEPVIDEDGDGIRYDEIPILKENDNDAYSEPLTYADGNARAGSPYIALTKEHEKNIWPLETSKSIDYLDDEMDYFGNRQRMTVSSVDFLIDKLKESKIPVLLFGGFFDGFSRGIAQSFANLQETNPAYLVMLPKFHIPFGLTDQYSDLFGIKYNSGAQQFSMALQFFDKYLKGKDTNLDKKPPVRVHTAFDGWNFYETWPPKESQPVKYHLGSDNSLTQNSPEEAVIPYEVDFTHSSSYNSKKINPQLMHMINDSLMIRNEHDKKCLVFETPVLAAVLTLTGSPIVNLHVSSNQANADVYVYLSDVDTTGIVYYVTEGKLRAGWHKLYDNNLMVKDLYDVKPELPWHSFLKEDYDPAPFADSAVVNLVFDLKPLSWKFKVGHKIRISIAGADYENYEFNPGISPDNTMENCQPTTLNIHTGNTYPSYVDLPVVY